jgi:hypothetical protein
MKNEVKLLVKYDELLVFFWISRQQDIKMLRLGSSSLEI